MEVEGARLGLEKENGSSLDGEMTLPGPVFGDRA